MTYDCTSKSDLDAFVGIEAVQNTFLVHDLHDLKMDVAFESIQ